MSAEKVRVAMLSFAHVHAEGYAKQAKSNPFLELVAVWDEEEYGGRQAAQRHGLEFTPDLDVLLARDDIDAVIVNAVTSEHANIMVKAANAGKHIFTEKALAMTVEECDRIIAAVERSGVKFMISLPSRCSTDLLFAKKAVQDGLLGELTFGRGRIAHSAALDRWFGGTSAWFADKTRAGGGALFDLGCHRMDVIPWLMGRPTKVTALINNFTNVYPIDDNSVVLFEFENRAFGIVDCTWIHRSGPNMLELYGTEGSLVLGHGSMHFETRKLSAEQKEKYLVARPAAFPSPMEQWANAIVKGTPMTITIQDGRNLTEVLQAAYLSAEQGRTISLPL